MGGRPLARDNRSEASCRPCHYADGLISVVRPMHRIRRNGDVLVEMNARRRGASRLWRDLVRVASCSLSQKPRCSLPVIRPRPLRQVRKAIAIECSPVTADPTVLHYDSVSGNCMVPRTLQCTAAAINLQVARGKPFAVDHCHQSRCSLGDIASSELNGYRPERDLV